MGSKKQWHHKTVTGCKTCRTRRIKCDEGKPHCRQCIKSDRPCEGYKPPRKAWIFELRSEQKLEANRDRSSQSGSDKPCPDYEIKSQALKSTSSPIKPGNPPSQYHPPSIYQHGLTPPHSLPGPYRQQEEQFLFKFFIEVAMTTHVSRSAVDSQAGEPFWKVAFPQIAWHLDGARWALLAIAMVARNHIQNIFLNVPQLTLHPGILECESRAMGSVVRQADSLEGVLITSMAFWVIAILNGDYARGLQHAYFCQRIIQSHPHLQESDSPNLKYCNSLSRGCLEYFRATRGPCSLHHSSGSDIKACSSSCFIPEDYPVHVRVADMLHHLREAYLAMAACRHRLKSLDNGTGRHFYHSELIHLLENSLSKVRFIIHLWSDHKHLDIPSPTFERDARKLVSIPYTTSPFKASLTKIYQAIGSESFPNAALFAEVEHLMHDPHIMPQLFPATSRGHPKMLRDFGFLVFVDSKAYADLDLQEDYQAFLKMETEFSPEEEVKMWEQFVVASNEPAMMRAGDF